MNMNAHKIAVLSLVTSAVVSLMLFSMMADAAPKANPKTILAKNINPSDTDDVLYLA